METGIRRRGKIRRWEDEKLREKKRNGLDFQFVKVVFLAKTCPKSLFLEK
jgi:hypothetical protein